MKKPLLFLPALAILISSFASAQSVHNGSFEDLNADGTLRNWGNVYLVSVWIDSSGVSHFDSIVYDNRYYGPSTDAFNGSHCLELRNAWNFTTNTGIAGAAAVDDDTVFTAYGITNPISIQATQFNPYRSFNFSFFYKYFPLNGDSAFASISMWDSSGNVIGEGSLIITNGAPAYTRAVVPINYSTQDTVAFYSLYFSTFYSAEPGSHQPSFGTYLLVDDVVFNLVSSAVDDQEYGSAIRIFPNPAYSVLHFNRLKDQKGFSIFDLSGKLVLKGNLNPEQTAIDIKNLQPGFYSIDLADGKQVFHHSFIRSTQD